MIPSPQIWRTIIPIFIIARTACHMIMMNDETEPAKAFLLNETVFLSLTLNSHQDVKTNWLFTTANVSDTGLITRESRKVNLKKCYREVLENMTVVESVVVQIEGGGTFTVRVFNTSSNETVALYNRSVMIAGSQSIEIKLLGEVNPENLQAGQNYSIGCFVSGFAHGPVVWDWSDCVTQMSDCNAKWTLAEFGKWWSADLANLRIHVFSTTFNSIGTLRCTVKGDTKNITSHLEIFPSDIPDTQLRAGFITIPRDCVYIDEGDSTNISCQMQRFGFRDTMTWLRLLPNDTLIQMTKQKGPHIIHRKYLGRQHLLHFEPVSTSLSKSFILTLKNISEADGGYYFCTVTDKCGRSLHQGVRILVKLNLNDSRFAISRPLPSYLEPHYERHRVAIILGSVAGIILMGFTIVIVRLLIINARKSKDLCRLEKELENNEFDPTLLIFEQLEKCPVPNPGYRNDMRTDRLILDRRTTKMLGQGNFGIVQQVGLRKFDGTVEPVALKQPLSDSDARQYRTLYKEICLMSYLGHHPNIVNMIGYVKNIGHGQLYLVMEYCSNGCLLEYLTTARQPLSSLNLTSYAYQVALAMEYLGSFGFIHRDLAARNILLTQNLWIAKLADFGLGMQHYRVVDPADKPELPWRWTAPEALLHGLFSVTSDVWSFGVLLGEIFSHGAIPFSDQTGHLRSFAEKCLSGQISPEKPDYATEAVDRLIQDCCQPDKSKRITFTNAQSRLSVELSSMDLEYHKKLKVMLDFLVIQIADTAFGEKTTEPDLNRRTKTLRSCKKYSKSRAPTSHTSGLENKCNNQETLSLTQSKSHRSYI